MDDIMDNPGALDSVVSSLMDLHNFGFPQGSDSLFGGTPSQESPQEMQVENTEIPTQHMDEPVAEVSTHVDSLEAVFTTSHDCSHLGLVNDTGLESDSDDDRVRQSPDESEEEDTREPLSYELSQGFRILREVMADSNKSVNWPFMNEIDPERDAVPDYYQRVEKPMWLQKMKEKFDEREYESVTEFVGDFRQMLENCYRYNGPDHPISKRGQRLETILEQKLTLLSRELREKTSISATSGKSVEEKQITGTRRRKVLVPHDSTALLNQLRMEEKDREKEARKVQLHERQKEREQFISELQGWEESLMDNKMDQFKAMWELPQIGHFFFLCQQTLNIGEVIQYELERGFYMPRESPTFQNMMTTLLSTPYQRSKLDSKPMMPYKVWDEKLRLKLRQWYKLYKDSKRNFEKTCAKFGLDHRFFKIVGNKNPLETKKYHELSVYQRVWIVKGLCDHSLETQESIREGIESQSAMEQREYQLGVDGEGYRFVHFPQFCGADLRIYRQAPIQYPKTERRKKSPTKQEASSPTKAKRKGPKQRKKPARVTPPPSPSRPRQSRLRQNPRQAAQYKAGDSSSAGESEEEDAVTEGNESGGPTPRKQRRAASKRASSTSVTPTPSEVDAQGNPLILRRSIRKVLEESKNFTPLSTPDTSRGGTPTRTSLRRLAADASRSSTPSISSRDSLSVSNLTRESRDSSPAPSGTESVGTPRKAAIRGGRRRGGRRGRRKKLPSRTGGGLSDGDGRDDNVRSEDGSIVSQPFESYKDVDTDSIAGTSNFNSNCPLLKDKRITNTPSPDIDKMAAKEVDDKALGDAEMRDEGPSPQDTESTLSSSTGSSVVHRSALTPDSSVDLSSRPPDADCRSTSDLSIPVCDEQKQGGVSEEASVKSEKEDASSISGPSSVSSPSEISESVRKSEEKMTERLELATHVKEEIDDVPTHSACASELEQDKCRSPAECKPGGAHGNTGLVKEEDVLNSELVNGVSNSGDTNDSVVKMVKDENCANQADVKMECVKDEPCAESYNTQEVSDNVEEPLASSADEKKPAVNGEVSEEKKAVDKMDESSDDDWEEQLPEIGQFELVADSVDLLKELANKYAEPEPVVMGIGKKQKVIKPIPRKRCETELHDRLLYLLKELEPWESKLLQAARKARMKMRKEYDSYKEEPEAKEIEDVWESEESGSESSDDSDSEDTGSNKAEDDDSTAGQEGKLRSGKVRKKEDNIEVAAEILQEVSSRGRIRKRKIIPNGPDDDASKRGKSSKEPSPSPAPNILQRNKGAAPGVKMMNLGQLRLQQPQGVSLLGGNQTLLIQGAGQHKGVSSNLAMKNSTLFAQLTNKNPAQQPQAQQINLKPGQNVNEVIKALLASGKQVAITANPQQLQMIAANQQPKLGNAKSPGHPQHQQQQLILAPQQLGKQQMVPNQTVPAILKPRPVASSPASTAQISLPNNVGAQKSPVKAVTHTVSTSNIGGTQYFSYNNLGQLPANVIQELLKKQNARLTTSLPKVAGTTEPASSAATSTTAPSSTALASLKHSGLILAPGPVTKQPGAAPAVLVQKAVPAAATKLQPASAAHQTVSTSPEAANTSPAKAALPPNTGVAVKTNTTVAFTSASQVYNILASPTKPKYAGNVTVKTLLENRAAGNRPEVKKSPAPVLLSPGVLRVNPGTASTGTATSVSVAGVASGAGLPAAENTAITVAHAPEVSMPAASVITETRLTTSSSALSSVPAPASVLARSADPVIAQTVPSAASKPGVISVPRLLLQGSTPIGQIPANLLPAAIGNSKVAAGAQSVIGGQQIKALITGGGKGPQMTTITTGQLQAAIAKKQVIDNAVKAVFTTGVTTSLPTAQIKVSSPFAMPSRNPHRPVTITTSAMKAPIPALPQVTSNVIKKSPSLTNSVASVQVQGTITTSVETPQEALLSQAPIEHTAQTVTTGRTGYEQSYVGTAPVAAAMPAPVQPAPTAPAGTSVAVSGTSPQVKPMAVKVTTQNVRTSQGVVPGVILPPGVAFPPAILQQIASKQQGVVFLQQGKDGAMHIIQLPGNQSGQGARAVEHTPGKLELPRVPTPTILKPAVPSEAANLQQQKLLQQQAAAAKGIVSHQVSATPRQLAPNQPPVVSPSDTTLSLQQLVSPTSVTVLPSQAVAIKGQSGTQIVSPSGNQMIASQLLLAATNIQQQQQQQIVTKQALQIQSPSKDGPVAANRTLAVTTGPASLPQAVKLGTLPISPPRVSNKGSTVDAKAGNILPQAANQALLQNQKLILQSALGSPVKTQQITPAQLQLLQQQLLQLQKNQLQTSPGKQQVVHMPVQGTKPVLVSNSPAGIIQHHQGSVAAAAPVIVSAPLAASPGKVALMVPNQTTAPAAVRPANSAGKLVLFNVNGQLVTAQGVPVNIGQGGLKLAAAAPVPAAVQAPKAGTLIQTAGQQTQPLKQHLILAGNQVVQGAQVVARPQQSQIVLQNPGISQARIVNSGQIIAGPALTTRLPVLQQGQVILQQGQVIGQPANLGSLQLVTNQTNVNQAAAHFGLGQCNDNSQISTPGCNSEVTDNQLTPNDG